MSFPLEGAATPAEIDAGRPKRMGFLERIHACPAYARAPERSGSDMLLN
jgi:glutathione S-transferase